MLADHEVRSSGTTKVERRADDVKPGSCYIELSRVQQKVEAARLAEKEIVYPSSHHNITTHIITTTTRVVTNESAIPQTIKQTIC